MKKYILICNPQDYELAKVAIQLKEDCGMVEITQSNLVDKGKVLMIDVEDCKSFSIDRYVLREVII